MTSHLAFSFIPADVVVSHTTVVVLVHQQSAFAVLQSRVHEPWARHLSSSMRNDLRYTPSDCFETFPFPQPDPRTVIPELEAIGETLYEARALFMVDTNQGLTKTYNAIKEPACDDSRVVELRRLHEEMDRAALDAYGWGDVVVPPYCPKSDADRAAVQAFEDEVIDRLYMLNAERAREEERLGLGGKKVKAADANEAVASAKKRGKKAKPGDASDETAADPGQGKLF